MLRRWSVAVALAGLTGLVGVAHALGPGQVFKSPLKNFTVKVPSLLFKTKVQEEHTKDGGVVAFIGSAGEFQRIDYFGRSADNPVPADSAERHAHYHRMVDALVQGHAGSQVLAEHDVTIDGIGMLQALVSFPAGSHLQNVRTGKPIDSVRGLLVFTRGGFTYLLQDEVGAPVLYSGGQVPATDEMGQRADESLPKLYQAIVFQ